MRLNEAKKIINSGIDWLKSDMGKKFSAKYYSDFMTNLIQKEVKIL